MRCTRARYVHRYYPLAQPAYLRCNPDAPAEAQHSLHVHQGDEFSPGLLSRSLVLTWALVSYTLSRVRCPSR
jgi:hypothetical protein